MNTKKIILDILSFILAIAVLFFLGAEISKNWAQIRTFSFHFNYFLLASASLSYVASFFVLAFGWHLLNYYLNYHIPPIKSLLYFFITQPAKYIPGKVWVAVMRMKFLHVHKVPNSVTVLVAGIEAIMEVFAGCYVSVVALMQVGLPHIFSVWGIVAATVLGLVLLIPDVFYFFVNIYLRIAKKDPIEKNQRVSFSKLIVLQVTYVLAMLGLGISNFLFLQSFAPVGREQFIFLISIGTFSYVASILWLFTPSGLGAREGVWFFALRKISALHIALIFTVASRLWTISLDIIMALVAYPILLLVRKKDKI